MSRVIGLNGEYLPLPSDDNTVCIICEGKGMCGAGTKKNDMPQLLKPIGCHTCNACGGSGKVKDLISLIDLSDI